MAIEISDLDIEKVEAALKAGAGFERAMGLLGVSRRTAYRWKAKGLEDLEAGEDTPLARLARVAEVERAKRIATSERAVYSSAAAKPEDLSSKDWLHLHKWILGTLCRDEYGEAVNVRIQGAVETLLSQVEPHMPRQSYADLLSALATVAGLDFGASGEADDDDAEDAHPLH
jgi:hypothetical protein